MVLNPYLRTLFFSFFFNSKGAVLLEVSILMNGILVFEGNVPTYSRNELTGERTSE